MTATNAPEWAQRLRESNGDGKLPAFAWPGGYAVAYVTSDGAMLCADCCNNPDNPVHFDTSPAGNDGWALAGYSAANWHDIGTGDWICDHCGKVIDDEPEP